MFNIRKKLFSDLNHEKLDGISEILEEMVSDSEISEEYKEKIRVALAGLHFDSETLNTSGVNIVYNCDEVTNELNSLGISFHPCVTIEDITYTVNKLYSEYNPLISDLSTAVKFAEKFIKDLSWPIKFCKPYMIWRLSKDHSQN